jgi:signal recognition particle receptor subunit beta
VANKQDLPNAMSLEEIKAKLKLPDKIEIVPCVATQKDSVEWVLNKLLEKVDVPLIKK